MKFCGNKTVTFFRKIFNYQVDRMIYLRNAFLHSTFSINLCRLAYLFFSRRCLPSFFWVFGVSLFSFFLLSAILLFSLSIYCRLLFTCPCHFNHISSINVNFFPSEVPVKYLVLVLRSFFYSFRLACIFEGISFYCHFFHML